MATGNWTEADVMAHNARVGKHVSEVRRALNESQEANAPAEKKRLKYGNKKTVRDGIVFDSGHEAERYSQLRVLEAAGAIMTIGLQPKWSIFAHCIETGEGIEVASFKADFSYYDIERKRIVYEDTKSVATKGETAYRLRKKLVEACYGITIEEI